MCEHTRMCAQTHCNTVTHSHRQHNLAYPNNEKWLQSVSVCVSVRKEPREGTETKGDRREIERTKGPCEIQNMPIIRTAKDQPYWLCQMSFSCTFD